MDDDVPKRTQKEESSDSVSDDSDLFESLRIRRIIQDGSGLDRFLLAYHGLFLPVISIVLWTLFLVIG
jgi:hypothetical protein